eukprot:TRINITY_DN10132_c0_g1_i1.p1 TRINITY_DN10132_c0_g1~~TRINITY_DN10132_c0_g1_i1.p1  ORF type:complete len:655 (+),score=121.50 TRINITY_DN10132_c0_g1_i1:308-2272(+)
MQLAFLAILLLLSVADCHTIKHIVVLMEENRSFDHLLGFYPGVNGLKGNEFNPFNTSDPSGGGYTVDGKSAYVGPCDPDHTTPATTSKIFGADAVARGDFTNPQMDGFVEWEQTHRKKPEACAVMSMFTPERLPVLSSLVKEFVLFDRFFSSHAGPTWPNRMFFLSATSAGSSETGPWYHNEVGKLFPQKTFYDQVKESGLTWKNYYNDTPWELFMESVAHNPEHLAGMPEFFEDAKKGTLPHYSFINPRSGINMTTGVGSNDMHPDHDIAAGEQYYKDIYEALRSSPSWNETLFIITFDEHGGFYDHVPTPLNVPPPGDGEKSYPDTDVLFNRLGIRIPTLLISPWVPKGMVVSEPAAAQKPAHNSEFDLTSIMATARKILGIKSGPLTKRDAWSATFENVLEIVKEPRTDCPVHLPEAPPVTHIAEVEGDQAPNELQTHIMTVLSHLSHTPFPSHIEKQRDVSHWVNVHYESHSSRTKHWKASKSATDYQIECQPRAAANWVDAHWDVNRGTSFVTINTKKLVASVKVSTTDKLNHTRIDTEAQIPYCLDAGKATAGTKLTISVCYPSPAPLTNRDPSQHWLWIGDSTFRPALDPSLCVTNTRYTGSLAVTLEPCDGRVTQHWGYHGPAAGNINSGDIYFGDATNSLGVVAK